MAAKESMYDGAGEAPGESGFTEMGIGGSIIGGPLPWHAKLQSPLARSDAIISAATLLTLLSLVLPVFCSSNQCWAVTSYTHSGATLSILPYLFCFPLVCFLLHASVPMGKVLYHRACNLPQPPPRQSSRPRDILAVVLPMVGLCSTVGVLAFILSSRDMIFGGPNRLGGTGSYSISIGIWAFALAGFGQTGGFLLRLQETGGWKAQLRSHPPPLPLLGALLMVPLWLGSFGFFLYMLTSRSDVCAPVELAALQHAAAPGVHLSFFTDVGSTPNGRSLHLGPPSQGAPYTVFIGSGGMSSMDKVRPIAHSLPYSSLLLDLQPLHGRGALRHLLHMCGCTVVGGRP